MGSVLEHRVPDPSSQRVTEYVYSFDVEIIEDRQDIADMHPRRVRRPVMRVPALAMRTNAVSDDLVIAIQGVCVAIV